MSTASLVFDIETIGTEFDKLDEISQDYLVKFAGSDEEKELIKEQTGFYPLTGEIVAIGVLNPETHKGAIFMRTKEGVTLPKETSHGLAIQEGSEKDILKMFWDIAKQYDEFISFNGRGFDVPYMMIRSAIHGIRPSKNLMSNRYTSYQPDTAIHIDLLDQLTFYGSVRRKFPLHMWTKAFGIESPKEAGIDGNDVWKLFKEGKSADIAEYNARDIISTAQLYQYWDKYIRF